MVPQLETTQQEVSEKLAMVERDKAAAEQNREVVSMQKPPLGVQLTMEAVCVMFAVPPVKKPGERPGEKRDDYWESAQRELLKEPKKLLDDMMNFDKDNIPDRTIAKVEPYLSRDDFEPSVVRKSSTACEAMCMWVRAMVKYHNVALAVEPKKQRLVEANAELDATTQKLEEAKQKLEEAE